MSRGSRKSELSPSVTRGGSNINLGKSDGVDMGRKTQPSVTSGGLGVTTEITNIGGVSVRGGVSADINPINLGVSYDPTENSVSVATGAEIPGGLLGVSGGVTVDINTGEITGGAAGVEALGLGVNVSNSKKDGLGVSVTVQFGPIEIELGFGFPSEKEEKPEKPTLPTAPSDIDGEQLPGDKQCSNGKYVLAANVSYSQYIFGKSGNYVVPIKELFEAIIFATIYDHEQEEADDIHIANSRWGAGNWQRELKSLVIKGNKTGYWFWLREETSLPLAGSNYGYIPVVEYTTTKKYFFYTHKNGFNADSYWFTGHYINCQITVTKILPPPNCPGGDMPPPPPFPNPPPRKRNMDECCRANLKFLRAIYTGLGIAKFPGKLPATIIQEIPKEGEQPAEPPQEPIADLVDLFMWQFRRDDERWGQWEIEINIKDADLTKEGNQGKSVKFPNLAESVAEIEGQMLSIQANVEALVALSIRNLSEAGMARQEAIKGYLASMAIAKYMAFPYKEFDVEIPSTYTPGATSIDKLIIESVIHTKGIDYEDKETQRDLLLDLLQAAAIIRAVNWRQVDPKSDVKKQILSQLKRSADLSERISNVKAVAVDGDTPQKKESWEDKLDAIENGFGFSTGIEDASTPYGRDRERRPRIRQIGDNIAQAGKDE